MVLSCSSANHNDYLRTEEFSGFQTILCLDRHISGLFTADSGARMYSGVQVQSADVI